MAASVKKKSLVQNNKKISTDVYALGLIGMS